MFDPTDEYGTGLLRHPQLELEHRNSTLRSRFLSSKAFLNPSFRAPAQWEEDPSETRPMFSCISVIVVGFLKSEIRRSHCISMISC